MNAPNQHQLDVRAAIARSRGEAITLGCHGTFRCEACWEPTPETDYAGRVWVGQNKPPAMVCNECFDLYTTEIDNTSPAR